MSLTLSTPLLARLQVDPSFNEDGSLQSALVQAFFGQNLINDATSPITVTPQPWPDATVVDCVKDAAKMIVIDGITLTYDQVARAIATAAAQERG